MTNSKRYQKTKLRSLANAPVPEGDVTAFYDRVLAQRRLSEYEMILDARVKRRAFVKESLKAGRVDFTKPSEQQWWAAEKPRIERENQLKWQSRIVEAMEMLVEAETDFRVVISKVHAGLSFTRSDGVAKRDWELALIAWSKFAGTIDGKTPLEWAVSIVDKVWPRTCSCVALRGTSIRAAVAAGLISYYIGYTHALSEAQREHEKIGFLTQKNRKSPVLSRSDGKHFSAKEVRTVLGFESLTLWDNDKKPMKGGVFARCIEGHIQLLLFNEPIGFRLNKAVDCGDRYPKDFAYHEVFLTCSPLVPSMLGKSVRVRDFGC